MCRESTKRKVVVWKKNMDIMNVFESILLMFVGYYFTNSLWCLEDHCMDEYNKEYII